MTDSPSPVLSNEGRSSSYMIPVSATQDELFRGSALQLFMDTTISLMQMSHQQLVKVTLECGPSGAWPNGNSYTLTVDPQGTCMAMVSPCNPAPDIS